MTQIVVRAPDSQQAMDEVLRRLGEGAFILGTRQVDGQVEIRASIEPPPRRAMVMPFSEALKARIAASGPPILPDGNAFAGIAAELRGAPSDGTLSALTKVLIGGASEVDLISDPPPRIVLAGPPGAGKSLLAVRLAAAMMLENRACLPQILLPWVDCPAADDRLHGWVRLLGRRLQRPRLADLLAAGRPEGGTVPEIVDLSDVPACSPQTVAELAAPAGTIILLVLPTGQARARMERLCSPWRGLPVMAAFTFLDQQTPSLDDLETLSRFGLPLATLAQGTSILDATSAATARNITDWALGWVTDAAASVGDPARINREIR